MKSITPVKLTTPVICSPTPSGPPLAGPTTPTVWSPTPRHHMSPVIALSNGSNHNSVIATPPSTLPRLGSPFQYKPPQLHLPDHNSTSSPSSASVHSTQQNNTSLDLFADDQDVEIWQNSLSKRSPLRIRTPSPMVTGSTQDEESEDDEEDPYNEVPSHGFFDMEAEESNESDESQDDHDGEYFNSCTPFKSYTN